MNKLTQAALVAFALSLSAGTVVHVTPAQADVAVTFDTGSVAFGYSDGYWDRRPRLACLAERRRGPRLSLAALRRALL